MVLKWKLNGKEYLRSIGNLQAWLCICGVVYARGCIYVCVHVCVCMCVTRHAFKERMTFKIGPMPCRFTHKHGALHIYIEFVRDFSTGLV